MGVGDMNGQFFWKRGDIKFRPLSPDDWQQFFAEQEDSEGNRAFNAGIDPVCSRKTVMEKLESLVNDADAFGIENREGELAGFARIHSKDERNGTFSFTIRVFTPHRRRGYAKDAFLLLLRYGFHELRFQKANSVTVDFNNASIQMHKSLGFTEEGRIRRNAFTGGEYHDEVLFGMTREEFDAIHQF